MLGLELDVGAWAKPPCFCMDFYTFQTNGYANRTCGASFMDQPSWTLHLGNGDWRCGTRFVCSLGRQFGLWVLGHAARDPLTRHRELGHERSSARRVERDAFPDVQLQAATGGPARKPDTVQLILM